MGCLCAATGAASATTQTSASKAENSLVIVFIRGLVVFFFRGILDRTLFFH